MIATKDPTADAGPSRIQVYEVATGEAKGPVLELPAPLQDAALSPDGQILALVRDTAAAQQAASTSGDGSRGRQSAHSSWPQRSAPTDVGGYGVHGKGRGEGERAVQISTTPETFPGLEPAESNNPPPSNVLEFRAVATGKSISASIPLPVACAALAWHPDGQRIALSSQTGEVLLIDRLATNRLIQFRSSSPIPNHKSQIINHKPPLVRCLAFTPDGTTLITLGPRGEVGVWNVASGELRYDPLHHDAASCWTFALSPDGQHLATAASDGTVRVWTVGTGQPECPPLVHPGGVFLARFCPGGNRLLTVCHDGVTRIWHWRTSKLACPPLRQNDEVCGMDFTPDGRWLVTVCREGIVRLWDCRAQGQ